MRQLSHHQWRQSLTIFLVSVIFTGCATSNIQVLPPITSETVIPPDSGMVILQVADTTLAGRFYPISQITFAAKDVNLEEAMLPRVVAQEGYGKSTQLFIGILPADDYSITSIRSYHSIGDAYFSRFYPGDIDLGTFTVSAGEVTDLGTIAVFIDRSGEDYSYVSTRVAGNPRGLKFVNEYFPELTAGLSNVDQPDTWHPDGSERERMMTYRRATNRQVVTGIPYVDSANGIVSYPGHLGMITHRGADKQWSLEAFGDDIEITLLTIVDGTTLIITEFNELYFRAAGTSEWSAGAALPNERTALAGAFSDGNYLVTETDSEIHVWRSASLDDEWELTGSLTPKIGFFAQLDKSFGIDSPLSGGGHLQVGDDLYISAGNSLYRYSFSDNTFSDLDTPKVASLQESNGVLTMSSTDFFSSSNQVSFNAGQSWQSYNGYLDQLPGVTERGNRPKFMGHPIFTDARTGFAVHQAQSRKEADSPFLIRTVDGGSSWNTVPEPLPEGCASLVIANEHELLLRCFLSGEFYRSDDQGASWELEREVSEG